MPAPVAPPRARTSDPSLRLLRRRLRRRVLAHRRLLAASLAGVAVLAVVRALEPPAAPTVPLLVAARDLPPGDVLSSGDLEEVAVDPARRPARAVGTEAALGRTLAAPLGAGEPVTDQRLVAPGLLATTPDLTAVPVRVPDPAVVALLDVGDLVDVLAAPPRGGEVTTVASGARVLALPPSGDAAVGATAPPGRLVVLGVDGSTVPGLAGAAARDYLSLVWSD